MNQFEIERLIEAKLMDLDRRVQFQGDSRIQVRGVFPNLHFSLLQSGAQNGGMGAKSIPPTLPSGWSILTRKISGTWKAGILYRSYLFENYDASPYSVTGLLTSDTPDNSDTGWFTVSAGTEPFLKTTLTVDGTSGVVSLNVASIQHSGFVKTFLHDGGMVVSGDTIYTIASANIKIGKILASTSGSLFGLNYMLGARVMCGLQVVAYKSDGTDPQNIAALFPSPF